MSARNERRRKGLGRTQRAVLHVLASQGACTVRELSYHWPPATESALASAVARLAQRGLVDAADRSWQGARSYALTSHGADVERTLVRDFLAEDEDEPAEAER